MSEQFGPDFARYRDRVRAFIPVSFDTEPVAPPGPHAHDGGLHRLARLAAGRLRWGPFHHSPDGF